MKKTEVQAVSNGSSDLPPDKPHAYDRRDGAYRRYKTISFLAGIDLLTCEVTGIVRERRDSEDFIDFLKRLDVKYDTGIKINIIADIRDGHRSKAVMDYLVTRPGRFAFTFTPGQASWLNLVEGFFGKMARQALRGIRVKSLEELERCILKWVEATNNDKVICRWKWDVEDIEQAFTTGQV